MGRYVDVGVDFEAEVDILIVLEVDIKVEFRPRVDLSTGPDVEDGKEVVECSPWVDLSTGPDVEDGKEVDVDVELEEDGDVEVGLEEEELEVDVGLKEELEAQFGSGSLHIPVLRQVIELLPCKVNPSSQLKCITVSGVVPLPRMFKWG